MPRFIARPVTVEAHQWGGNTVLMPDDFRLSVQSTPDGRAVVTTLDGPKVAQRDDWIMRGPGGDFVVVRPAAFETMFEPLAQTPEPPAKRPYVRRNFPDAQTAG